MVVKAFAGLVLLIMTAWAATDQSWEPVGAFVTALGSVIALEWNESRRSAAGIKGVSTTREAQKRHHKWEIFISSPLAGFDNDEALLRHRRVVERVVRFLENELGLRVYWAGRSIRSRADFDAADIAADREVAAIRDSKYFLLLYPERLVSGALFEAGVALVSCLTSIYVVSRRSDLPFLMTQAAHAFRNVRLYESPDDLLKLLERHRVEFFTRPSAAETEAA